MEDPAGQVLRDLPLWRVQWAALPGTQVRPSLITASTPTLNPQQKPALCLSSLHLPPLEPLIVAYPVHFSSAP